MIGLFGLFVLWMPIEHKDNMSMSCIPPYIPHFYVVKPENAGVYLFLL